MKRRNLLELKAHLAAIARHVDDMNDLDLVVFYGDCRRKLDEWRMILDLVESRVKDRNLYSEGGRM